MKFESGEELRAVKKNIEEAKKRGEKPNGFDEYNKFNHELVPELLEKREKEREEFIKDYEEKRKKLEEAEKTGGLVFKK